MGGGCLRLGVMRADSAMSSPPKPSEAWSGLDRLGAAGVRVGGRSDRPEERPARGQPWPDSSPLERELRVT